MNFLCLVLLAPATLIPARAVASPHASAAAVYLRGLQALDGGFVPARHSETSSLRATTAAIRALKYFGGQVPNHEACRRFVQQCWDRDVAAFVDNPNSNEKPDVVTTAVGMMAVVALDLPVRDFGNVAIPYLEKQAHTFEEIRMAAAGLEAVGKSSPQGVAWLNRIEQMQKTDWTWGEAGDSAWLTASAVMTVLRLGGKVNHRERVIEVLKAGQRPDGGFGREGSMASDLSTTYRVMRAFKMLKLAPVSSEKVRIFVEKCWSPNGGYGVAPGKPPSVAATYFAGSVLHFVEEIEGATRKPAAK